MLRWTIGFGGILAALAVVELLVRATAIAPPGLRTYDASRGWKLRPGADVWQRSEGRAHVRVNRAGFRGSDVPLAKHEGEIRIAVLGDSFTEAVHVPYEDTFSAVTERELRECPALEGNDVEVLDFGVSGYGTAQELLTLREQVWRYSPDAVVLAVLTGNDVSDNSAALDTDSWLNGERCRPYFVYRDDALVLTREFSDSPVRSLWCRANFALSHLRVIKLIGDPIVALYERLSDRLDHDAEIKGHESGLDDRIYAAPASPAWRDAWHVTEGVISRMHREVITGGASFLVVTLSNPIQVYPDPDTREHYLQSIGGTDIFYPDRRISKLGVREGFPVLNLAPAMQRYADSRHVFLHGFTNTAAGVGHWNAAGHRLAGERIAETLCELIQSGSFLRPARTPPANQLAETAGACDSERRPCRPCSAARTPRPSATSAM